MHVEMFNCFMTVTAYFFAGTEMSLTIDLRATKCWQIQPCWRLSLWCRLFVL